MEIASLITADVQMAMIRGKAGQESQAAQAAQTKGLDMKKIDQAARDFEAVFLSSMMKPMFDGIDPDPMFGGGKGEAIFNDLMLDEYGKQMAANGGVGIADMVREELIRQQEGSVK